MDYLSQRKVWYGLVLRYNLGINRMMKLTQEKRKVFINPGLLESAQGII